MKICLFMLPFLNQGGGAEKYFIELAHHLSKEKGVAVDVITVDDSFFKLFAFLLNVYKLKPFAKIDISGREKEADVRKRLGKARWLKSSLKTFGENLRQYAVVYTKNEIVDLLLLKTVGYKKLPPIVVGVHTPVYYPQTNSFNSKLHNYFYGGRLYRFLLNGVALVHASNKFTASFLEKRFAVKTQLIPYPFSAPAQAKGLKETANKYHAPGKFNIIFAGRLGEQKGVDLLPEIASQIFLNNLSDKVCLNIFGSGEPFWNERLRELAQKRSWVRYYGHVEHKLMLAILEKQDLLISPSRWEVLPYNILEAQAAGLSVLAFDIPGPQDIIVNGKTGFLVKNKKEFLNKLVKLAKEGKHLSSKEVRENISRKFNPDKIYKDILKMFLKVKKGC
jgi:glycosyltransferase involved in cell wall biosynthesis